MDWDATLLLEIVGHINSQKIVASLAFKKLSILIATRGQKSHSDKGKDGFGQANWSKVCAGLKKLGCIATSNEEPLVQCRRCTLSFHECCAGLKGAKDSIRSEFQCCCGNSATINTADTRQLSTILYVPPLYFLKLYLPQKDRFNI